MTSSLFNMLPTFFGTFSCFSLGTFLHIVEIMFIKCYVYLELYFVCVVFYCFHCYIINTITNSLSFITKFITFVGKNDIMLGRVSHNIMFANSCNKFSNK